MHNVRRLREADDRRQELESKVCTAATCVSESERESSCSSRRRNEPRAAGRTRYPAVRIDDHRDGGIDRIGSGAQEADALEVQLRLVCRCGVAKEDGPGDASAAREPQVGRSSRCLAARDVPRWLAQMCVTRACGGDQRLRQRPASSEQRAASTYRTAARSADVATASLAASARAARRRSPGRRRPRGCVRGTYSSNSSVRERAGREGAAAASRTYARSSWLTSARQKVDLPVPPRPSTATTGACGPRIAATWPTHCCHSAGKRSSAFVSVTYTCTLP